MKKLILFCCILSLLCFTACKNKEVTEETEPLTETLYLDGVDILVPTEEEEPTLETEKLETLSVLEWGTYSGLFVEDGSDEAVENVICLLIGNTTDQYLDYGVVKATVGDRECSFVVSGLPGGAATWVLEESRQTMTSVETFSYVGQTVSQLKDQPENTDIDVTFLNGEAQVTNNSDKTYSQVRLYYKHLHTDGNYFGGICYTTVGENIAPGQTMTLPAGHSTENGCSLVRVEVVE